MQHLIESIDLEHKNSLIYKEISLYKNYSLSILDTIDIEPKKRLCENQIFSQPFLQLGYIINIIDVDLYLKHHLYIK